ncbi:MAG: hypothetical protein FWD73_16130 [Polyangiaceae bacterium]|nr:hypothetical protein [Polyangiaceae bacterium]
MTRRDLKAHDLVAPLIIALVPLFWVVDATARSSLTTLGRDQGIFQYVAWAVGNGEVDYRDVRDVNGPLIHLVHFVMLRLGGSDEHRFHVMDLWMTGVTFAFTGACIPGILRRNVSAALRAAWAAAAWVVLSAQYQLYTYWNQAQRESFCDWFLLPSLGLSILHAAKTKRLEALRLVAIAALSTVTWFGKPTFVLFTMVQVCVLLFDRQSALCVRTRALMLLVGGALGSVVPLAYLLRYGNAGAFLRISLVDVPNVYRFIWAKSAREILGESGPLQTTTAGLACAALLFALIVMRELPSRFFVLPLAILAGIGNVLAQHKGFDYHFHPLTALTALGWLVIVAMLSERFVHASAKLHRYVVLGAAAALAFEVASSMQASPQMRNVWILAGGETAKNRADPEYFATFRTNDFFPREMRQAARYLAEQTPFSARIQIYGMDPYLLFLARRKSATPYIYAYDLNADAALDGGWQNEPTAEQAMVIKLARDDHENDMLARLEARPPAAFVFIDASPLITYPDAMEDFWYCCAKTAEWVLANYQLAQSFGEFHIWMKNELLR